MVGESGGRFVYIRFLTGNKFPYHFIVFLDRGEGRVCLLMDSYYVLFEYLKGTSQYLLEGFSFLWQ